MWRIIGILSLSIVLFTDRSMEKPYSASSSKEDRLLTELSEYLKREADAPVQDSTQADSKEKETDKDPFMFIAKYKRFLLVSIYSTAKFNCTSNDPQASYKLIHENDMRPYMVKAMVPDGENFTQEGAVFYLKRPTLNDGGKYFCVANNKHGEEIKQQPILLFVTNQIFPNAKPTVYPSVAHAHFGDDVTFACASKGLGYTLTWQVKNEDGVFEDVSSNQVTEIPERKQGYIIRKLELSLTDVRPPPYTTELRCRLNFQGELRYSYARLEIYVPTQPQITHLPSFIGITEGSDFELYCRTSGSPPPYIMWSKDGKVIEDCLSTGSCYRDGMNYVISGEHNEVLKVKSATDLNMGNIVCHALNVAGMDEEVSLVRVYEKGYIPENHPHDLK